MKAIINNTFKSKFFAVLSFSLILISEISSAQNVGINSTGTPPHNSALFDADASPANDKGLLVPRIPLQAVNIAAPVTSPATSLFVYNTATAGTGSNAVSPGYYYWDGVKWVKFQTSVSSALPIYPFYLGQDTLGGIVFYIYIGADRLQHGLLVAKTETVNIAWQSSASFVNANRAWDGAYNTSLMTSSPAATNVASLGTGWFIPSLTEFELLRLSAYTTNKALLSGGYTLLQIGAAYWTSQELGATFAQVYSFYGGTISGYYYGDDKTVPHRVRGIKAF